MADFNAFMKNLSGQGGMSSKNYDVEDELNELEDEVNGTKGKKKGDKKKKKTSDDLSLSDLDDDDLNDDVDLKDDGEKGKGKTNSDDELAGLEAEAGDDDEEMELDDKPKPKPKEKKEEIGAAPVAQVPTKAPASSPKVEEKVDIYLEGTEELYHNVKKMNSLEVLEKEKEICNQIIKYKKDNKYEDYDIWEGKLDIINIRATNITNFIECGAMDIDQYKKSITTQMEYEKNLLTVIEKDKKLKPYEIPKLKERIQQRIDIINTELTVNPEEEEEEEEAPKEEEKVNPQEQPKEQPKEDTKKGDDKMDIDDKPKVNTIKEEKPKEIKVDESLLKRVNVRFNEYKCAIEYFKNNGLTKQQDSAILQAKEIVAAIKQIKNGEEIDEFALPNPITPEFIYGYTKEERLEKYKVILSELIKQKNEIKADIQKVVAKLQTLDKKSLKKIEGAAKKDLEEKKKKIEKYEKIIETIKQQCKNQWIPAPLFSKTTEEVKYEKINKNIPAETMIMTIGKTDYLKSDMYLYITLNSDTVRKETLYPKTKENYDKEVKWTFDKTEFKHLFRKNIEVQLYHKKFFGSTLYGTLKLNLTALKNQCEIGDYYTIDIPDKKEKAKIEIKLSLRTPIVEPEYISKPKEVFAVSKFYPEFKLSTTGGEPFEKSAVPVHTGPVPQPTQPRTAQPKPQAKAPQQQAKNPQPAPQNKRPHIDGSKFQPDDIKDPDNVNNLNSMQVLDYKIAELNQKINKIEGRTPKPLREKLVSFKCKKKLLEESLGDTIDPHQYLDMMKIQLEKDKLLAMYFQQEKAPDKEALVTPRIKLLTKEIKEIEAEL